MKPSTKDDIEHYQRRIKPVLAIAECVMSPEQFSAMSHFLQEPCILMLKFTQRVPEELVLAGTHIAGLSLKQRTKILIKARKQNRNHFKDSLGVLTVSLDFCSVFGREGLTLGECERQLAELLEAEYDDLSKSLDREFRGLVERKSGIDSRDVGQTLVGFMWECIIGEAHEGLSDKMKNILRPDDGNIVIQCERIIWMAAHPEAKETRVFAQSIVESWLGQYYQYGKGRTDNAKEKAIEAGLISRGIKLQDDEGRKTEIIPDVRWDKGLKSEEIGIDTVLAVKKITQGEKPKMKKLLELWIRYKKGELTTDEYKMELGRMDYKYDAARQAIKRLRDKKPDEWKDWKKSMNL